MTTNEEILKDYEKRTDTDFSDLITTYSEGLIELMALARQDEAKKIFAELEKKDADGRSAVFSMGFGISCDCEVCENYRKIRKKFGVE